MDLACEGNVLLVGDGDFSFSYSLLKHSALSASQVTTSNLETPESIQHHKLAKTNMAQLQQMGACVLLAVDARDLHNNPDVNKAQYTRVIFNFPLADRHNIKKNRALLADFFSSCTHILAPGGHVMVTLCKGQGGTPADQPQRSWHDSWQVQAMAANAGFVLSDVFAFDAVRYPEYHSVGFRFQDKSFNTGCSLTHVFEKVESVTVPEEFSTRGTVEVDGSLYSCSGYVSGKLERNLLMEEATPVNIVGKLLEASLVKHFGSTVLQLGADSAVLPGHRSLVTLVSNVKDTLGGQGDSLTEIKKKKDENNLSLKEEQKAAASFAHGIDRTTNTRSSDEECSYAGLLPCQDESVYILIKNLSQSECESVATEDGTNMPDDFDGNGSACSLDKKTLDTATSTDCTGQVFHHRTSLLENLSYICSVDHFMSGPENLTNASSIVESEAITDSGDISRPTGQGRSIVVLGQCCWPCPIRPNVLPVHHQLMFVCKDSTMREQTLEDCNAESERENISDQICTCLQNFSIEGMDVGRDELGRLSLQGFDKLHTVRLIKVTDESVQQSKPHQIGVTFRAEKESCQYVVALFHLDKLACHTWKIPDPRLLWSKNEKVLQQFVQLSKSAPSVLDGEESTSPSTTRSCFYPVSFFPMRYTHDLSFWVENTNTGSGVDMARRPFDEAELFSLVLCVAGDAVTHVQLVDTYTEPSGTMGRTSRCYRLHFLSHDLAFSYAVSWKLQSLIRVELSRKMCVALR